MSGPKPILDRISLHMQASVMHASGLSQVDSFNPCHAEHIYVLHSSPIFILLTYSIPVVNI